MKNNRRRMVRAAAILAAMVAAAGAGEKSAEVAFPGGYRSWQHVKSVVAAPGGKIFEFYANAQAVAGYRAGKFPNGSMLVRETLRAVAGEGDSKGMLTEGERTGVDVMAKDDGLFKETGGWGFESFDSKNARLAEKDRAQCYGCHSRQKDRDMVFSTLRQDADGGTPYPDGFANWTFLHSSIAPATSSAMKPCEKPCVAGLYHFYANDKAMVGLRTGTYPDGAVIAEELMEWLSPEGGPFAKEGKRRLVATMVKDEQRYSATGGWGYGTFDDGSRVDKLDAKARMACHQCHVARKAQGYVFTEYRER